MSIEPYSGKVDSEWTEYQKSVTSHLIKSEKQSSTVEVKFVNNTSENLETLLTITDSKDGGKITGGNVGKDVLDDRKNCGGGICSLNGGAIALNGGKICGNTAENRGGGIYTEGAMWIYGGKICDNIARFGGGICCRSIIKDPTDFDPSEYCMLTTDGCEIINNSASQLGGGIYLQDAVCLFVSGKITQNKAGFTEEYDEIGGGGLCINGGAIMFMANDSPENEDLIGEISKNETSGLGGGIYVRYGGMVIENVSITDNVADCGGAIAIKLVDEEDTSGNVMISGGYIVGNEAKTEAGAIYNPNVMPEPKNDDEPTKAPVIIANGGDDSGLYTKPIIIRDNIVKGERSNLTGQLIIGADENHYVNEKTDIWLNNDEKLIGDTHCRGDLVTHLHIDSKKYRYTLDEDGNLVKKAKPQIRFDTCGGSLDKELLYPDDDMKFSELPTPVRPGYVFLGWFTEKSGGTEITTDYKFEDKEGIVATVYAHWGVDYSNVLIPALVVVCLACVGLFALNRVKK